MKKKLRWIFLGILLAGYSLTHANPQIPEVKSAYVRTWNKVIYELKSTKGSLYRRELVDADPATFQVLDRDFARDKNSAYYRGIKIPDIDLSTFAGDEKGMSVDQFHALNETVVTYEESKKLLPDTQFEQIDASYARQGDHIYWTGVAIKKIDGIDAETFAVLGWDFLKDKNGIYLWHPYADEQGLEKLDFIDGSTATLVYARGTRQYIGDKNNIYIFDNYDKKIATLNGADIQSFVLYDKNFAKDRNHVYFQDKILEGADAATFQRVGKNYFKDKNSVYCFDFKEIRRIEQADPASFEIIQPRHESDSHRFYGRDRDNVYWKAIKIEGADVSTFEELTDAKETKNYIHGAKDKNNFYREGEKVDQYDLQWMPVPALLDRLERENAVPRAQLDTFIQKYQISLTARLDTSRLKSLQNLNGISADNVESLFVELKEYFSPKPFQGFIIPN